jgi:cytochrome b561
MSARSAAALVRPRPKAGRFDQVSIALHWLTLLLVTAQFATALTLIGGGEDSPEAGLLLAVHRSTGLAIWLAVAGRLVWRAAFAHLPPFPPGMPRLQQRIARANEYGLYALLTLQPLTGLGDTVLRGHPFVLFGLTVPRLTHPEKAVFHALHAAHELGAIALALLIALHAGAALFHGLVRRDGVVERMLPWTPGDR